MTTKQEEREALKQIRGIVKGLGEDSYIATAFDGCFEIAEQNIEMDMACSLKGQLKSEERISAEMEDELRKLKAELEKAQREARRLKQENERLYGWKPWEDPQNVSEESYQELLHAGGTRKLSEEDAKNLLHQDFGFDPGYIEIRESVGVYQRSEHFQILRRVGELERRALYNAADWNYIRFDCGIMQYELWNGELRFYQS